jgi:RimJ/RimL family protein N-acetyltransferase
MKIELRKFKMSDFDRLMEMFPEKEITDAIGITLADDSPKVDSRGEMKWMKKTLGNYRKKKPSGYNLAVIADGVYVGNVGAHNIDHKNCSAEVGYWIGKEYWGNGIATSALNLFIDEISKKFKLKRIAGFAYTFNPASKRVMEKCGFELECIRKCTKKGKNKYYDDYQLSKIL